MNKSRVEARAKRLHAMQHPRPLTPRGDWVGRCTRCGEVVSGTVQEIIAKHKHCKPQAERKPSWLTRMLLWLHGLR